MADPITPAAPVQQDAKAIAGNILRGITERSTGKSPNQPPPPAPDPKANGNGAPPPVDPNAGKEKYVVDGKDVWLTPTERTAWIQKGMAFEPRVTQLNQLQREVGLFFEKLKSDPGAVLFDQRIGLTPELAFEKIMGSAKISDATKEKVGKWYYENVIEPGKLTPEELKAREDAKWRADREKQDVSAKDQAIFQENQRKVADATAHLKNFIGEAMKESGLPNNDTPIGAEMARMVADTMRVARHQQQNLTPKQAIEFVKKRMMSVQQAYYDHLDGASLMQELGEANVDKLKKHLLKLAKDAGLQPPNGNGAGAGDIKPRAPRQGERKIITQDEFHDYLAELKKKG